MMISPKAGGLGLGFFALERERAELLTFRRAALPAEIFHGVPLGAVRVG